MGLTTINDLANKQGHRFKATTKDGVEFEGKIFINMYGTIYLCNNIVKAEHPDELFGYKYAWSIGRPDIVGELTIPGINTSLLKSFELIKEGEQKLRYMGWYQPFGSLMLYGKIETRLVRKGKKPPFPLGKYLITTTQKYYGNLELREMVGEKIFASIIATLQYNGDRLRYEAPMAIGIGELVEVRPMLPEDEDKCFFPYSESDTHVRWCLVFKDVKAINPFLWNYGKQGVGFVPEFVKNEIILINQ